LTEEDEKTKKEVPKHATNSATCALGEIMEVGEMRSVVLSNYPLFFSTILLRFGMANGHEEPTQ